jgi:hypothetical protein
MTSLDMNNKLFGMFNVNVKQNNDDEPSMPYYGEFIGE